MSALTALPQSSLGWARPCSTDRTMASATTTRRLPPPPHANVGEPAKAAAYCSRRSSPPAVTSAPTALATRRTLRPEPLRPEGASPSQAYHICTEKYWVLGPESGADVEHLFRRAAFSTNLRQLSCGSPRRRTCRRYPIPRRHLWPRASWSISIEGAIMELSWLGTFFRVGLEWTALSIVLAALWAAFE